MTMTNTYVDKYDIKFIGFTRIINKTKLTFYFFENIFKRSNLGILSNTIIDVDIFLF